MNSTRLRLTFLSSCWASAGTTPRLRPAARPISSVKPTPVPAHAFDVRHGAGPDARNAIAQLKQIAAGDGFLVGDEHYTGSTGQLTIQQQQSDRARGFAITLTANQDTKTLSVATTLPQACRQHPKPSGRHVRHARPRRHEPRRSEHRRGGHGARVVRRRLSGRARLYHLHVQLPPRAGWRHRPPLHHLVADQGAEPGGRGRPADTSGHRGKPERDVERTARHADRSHDRPAASDQARSARSRSASCWRSRWA